MNKYECETEPNYTAELAAIRDLAAIARENKCAAVEMLGLRVELLPPEPEPAAPPTKEELETRAQAQRDRDLQMRYRSSGAHIVEKDT